MTAAITSLGDVYNARWLTPAEVAATFVPPPQFKRLLARTNSMVIGPRGSGKTTLLKMLTPPAQASWKGHFATVLKRRVDYIGVFIATDVGWEAQLRSLGGTSLDRSIQIALGSAAVVAHAHKAIIETAESLPVLAARRQAVGKDWPLEESAVCEQIAALLRLRPRIFSLRGIRDALMQRLAEISETAFQLGRLSGADQVARFRETRSVDLLLLPSAKDLIEQLNDLLDQRGAFWGLLFDELELMPLLIRREILTSLRGVPSPLILKVAISPFDDETSPSSPWGTGRPGHDFDVIPLWYAKKTASQKFCARLWRGLMHESSLKNVKPERIFGTSLLATSRHEWASTGTVYKAGSRHVLRMRALANRDATFAAYLDRNNISLDAPEYLRSDQRAATLRKAYPLAVSRLEYLRWGEPRDEGESESTFRSRKRTLLYSGWQSLCALSEGNPRIFIGLLGGLLDHLGDDGRVPPSAQATEVSLAATRFEAYVRTMVPVAPRVAAHHPAILELLIKIGIALRHRSLKEPFSADAPGAFIVDSACGEEIRILVGHALNIGAIIHVPKSEGGEELFSRDSVLGRRFRLSYLFVTRFGLVPRLGRAVKLSDLLHLPVGDNERQLFEDGK